MQREGRVMAEKVRCGQASGSGLGGGGERRGVVEGELGGEEKEEGEEEGRNWVARREQVCRCWVQWHIFFLFS